MTYRHTSGGFYPRPFDTGHALCFTVREIYESAGEFLSQYSNRQAAAYAFSMAQKHASYAELRGADGQVIADYLRGEGEQWYAPRDAREA